MLAAQMCPPKRHFEVPPVQVTLPGNTVFADVIKVSPSGCALKSSVSGVFVKMGNWNTVTRRGKMLRD